MVEAKIMAEGKNISTEDFEKLQYQKACGYGSHLSHVFYITLGFFILISGWFFANNGAASLANNNILYNLSGFIGILFFLLLLNLAKVSRLHFDNQEVIEKFDKDYDPNDQRIKFHLSGIRGIGDFLHYFILTALTIYFLCFPFNYKLQSTIIITFIAFIVFFTSIYYVLAAGKFPFGKERVIKSPTAQWFFTYLLLTFALCYFTYLLFKFDLILLLGGYVVNPYYLGLLLSLVGILLLGFFGLPITYLELTVVEWGGKDIHRVIRQIFSWLGLIITFIGFMLQFKFR